MFFAESRRFLRFARGAHRSIRPGGLLLFLLLSLLVSGCATHKVGDSITPRPFEFDKDTFVFENGLVWEYGYDAKGEWHPHKRQPAPDYAQHCFVVARSVRQFFDHARFDSSLPKTTTEAYRRIIRQIVSSNPRTVAPDSERVVVPGYSDLRSFSSDHEDLLKAECGGAWQSYFQRGHWRMIFPFSRSHQAKTASDLAREVRSNRPAILHLLRFPQLSINHAVVAFDVQENPSQMVFLIYDPNQPALPALLIYERATRTFFLPPNKYFYGGRVDVYEVFRGALY